MTEQELTEVTDAKLVERAQAGSLESFEALTRRYEERVYAASCGLLGQVPEAEDITLQTFLSALEHLDRFRGETSFGTWLLCMATRAALKRIGKAPSLETVSLEENQLS